jgi:hypothetical protein
MSTEAIKVTVIKVDLDVNGDGDFSDLVDGVANYLPGYEGTTAKIDDTHTQNMKIIVEGVGSGTSVKFELADVTDYEGFCGNAKATGFDDEDTDRDLILNSGSAGIGAAQDANDTAGVITKTAGADNKAWCWIRCRDYAAETKVNITIGSATAPQFTLTLPENTDAATDDHLPDLWEGLFGVDLKDKDDDDVDFDGKHTEKGDGFGAFEEYRGFRILDPSDPTKRIHKRTNEMTDHTPGSGTGRNGGPLKKDLFVADVGTEPPFRTYGSGVTVFGISWHMVHYQDKGTDPTKYQDESGPVNRNTSSGFKVQDQFAILIKDIDLPTGVLGSAQGLEVNDSDPAVFDLAEILVKLARFNITPSSDPAAVKKAKEAVLAHELGHRLTLRHLFETYTLDADDVKAQGSAPQAAQIAILVDGANKIQTRLKIQRRKDTGHVNEGYTTQIVAYDNTSGRIAFSGTATEGALFTGRPELETTQFEIPPGDVTTVTAGTPVELADVVFTFQNNVSGLIQDVKNGTKTATVKIWRGYTCLMDAKIVEQDPQFGLISADPSSVDLRPRIQLKASRTAVGGEHNLAIENHL